MESEKDIFRNELSVSMAEQDKPRDYLVEEGLDSLEYRTHLGRGEERDVDFERYLGRLTAERRFFDTINPYGKDPLKPLTDKVEDFLQRHAGLSYAEFVRQANPYDFEEDDYSEMPKKALRRRLFDHRARLYIAALYDCEQEGMSVEELLRKIRDKTIPPLKKERREPTFEAILKALGKKD